MKKISVVLIVIFVIFLLIPNLKAEDTVKIKSISLESKSINAYEKSVPTYNGLDLNFDLEFRELNDYVKYKIIIENNTDKDYFLEEDLNFNNSEFMKYNFYTEDNIKSKSESVIYLDVVYNNEIKEAKFNETNKAGIKLLNENGEAAINPDTGDSFDVLTLLVLILSAFVLLGFLGKGNIIKLSIFLICIIPVITFAAETMKIGINTNVLVQKSYKFGYVIDEIGYVIPYEEKDKYDLSKTTCYNLYTKDYSASDKYLVCDRGVIYMENRAYVPGEIIYYSYPSELRLIDVSFVYNQCDIDDENKTIYCDHFSQVSYSASMYYRKDAINKYGYTYFDDDVSKMKFYNFSISENEHERLIDLWERDGYFSLYHYSVENKFDFIMPKHDVLFTYGQREM